MPFSVHATPLSNLQALLPLLLSDLSIARGQIAVDQIRLAISADPGLVFVATVVDEQQKPVAAAVVIRTSPTPGNEEAASAATVVHIGSVASLDAPLLSNAQRVLNDFLDRELANQGVEFLQWASDPNPDSIEASSSWYRACGFEHIAQLEYLSGSLAENTEPASTSQVVLEPIELDDTSQWKALVEIVEQTYRETADCPDLAKYRRTEQTLCGYRASGSFAPELWFRIRDTTNDRLAGVLILAQHRRESASSVIELVYMGVLPEARGHGIGRELVRLAMQRAGELGAEQMIMAVDQANHWARRIYHQLGFAPVLSESVWVKRVGQAA